MTLHRVCSIDDLPEGQARVFDIGPYRIAFARAGTAVFAIEDRCSHDDGELGDGAVHDLTEAGGEIACPRHGGRFDMASGRATRMPAIAPVETFDARVDAETFVVVELPED